MNMPSMTTVYRFVVMMGVGLIVVTGWKHFGPSTEQVKSFAVAGMEKAKAAWNASSDGPAANVSVADPRTATQSLVSETPASVSGATSQPPAAAPQLVPLANSGQDTIFGAGNSSVMASPGTMAAELETGGVVPLLAKLQQIGGADAKVVEWGSSGELYRCSCRAKSDASPLARHFEAVAAEPVAAVEQVVAKVEAWQSQQQNVLR
jgi:hypothetical protein